MHVKRKSFFQKLFPVYFCNKKTVMFQLFKEICYYTFYRISVFANKNTLKKYFFLEVKNNV